MVASHLRRVLSSVRIVTRPRGSWKWQDAYGITTYGIKRTKKAPRLVWYSYSTHGKFSLPQLTRMGYGRCAIGSIHHQPITRADLAKLLRSARRAIGRKASRAYRLAKALIPGLLEARKK